MDDVSDLARLSLRWVINDVRENLATLLVLAVLGDVAWLFSGRALTGTRRRQWFAVPALLLLTILCLAGPGRLFPKVPWEGPSLVILSSKHALTVLDLPGLASGASAIVLALHLVNQRLRQRRH